MCFLLSLLFFCPILSHKSNHVIGSKQLNDGTHFRRFLRPGNNHLCFYIVFILHSLILSRARAVSCCMTKCECDIVFFLFFNFLFHPLNSSWTVAQYATFHVISVCFIHLSSQALSSLGCPET